MKSYKNTLAFLACAFAASASNAATIDVKFDANIFAGSGYDNVTIKAANLGALDVSAGRFQGTASNLVDVSPSLFVDGLNDLFMYCYDIYQRISGGASVKYTINPTGESARTLDFLGAVNKVMNSGNSVYDPFAWLHPLNGKQGAAIQIGIWESKYENDVQWDLTSGSFEALNLDKSTSDWWNSFKNEIDHSDALDGRYVAVLENSNYQDMIVGDPPALPEPGSLALIALALGGLAFTQRKRAQQAS
jgi:hypothetical protein